MTARVDKAEQWIDLKVLGVGRWIPLSIHVPASVLDAAMEAVARVVAKADDLDPAETAALIETVRRDARSQLEQLADIADDHPPMA